MRKAKFGKKELPKKDALASKPARRASIPTSAKKDRKIAMQAGLLGVLKGAAGEGAVPTSLVLVGLGRASTTRWAVSAVVRWVMPAVPGLRDPWQWFKGGGNSLGSVASERTVTVAERVASETSTLAEGEGHDAPCTRQDGGSRCAQQGRDRACYSSESAALQVLL